jgi:subtilisin family serine protease
VDHIPLAQAAVPHSPKFNVVPDSYIVYFHNGVLPKSKEELVQSYFTDKDCEVSEVVVLPAFGSVGVTAKGACKVARQVATVYVQTYMRDETPLSQDANKVANLVRRGFSTQFPYKQTGMNSDMLKKYELDGKGVQVAMLDGGFDLANAAFHELKCKQKLWFNGKTIVNADNPQLLGNGHGHGTMALSVLAAKTGDYVGIAPNAEYHIAAAASENPKKGIATNLSTMQIYQQLVKDGVDLLTTSMAHYFEFPLKPAHTFMQAIEKRGILFVIAAGNVGKKGLYGMETLASYPTAVAVGAVENQASSKSTVMLEFGKDWKSAPLNYDRANLYDGEYTLYPTIGHYTKLPDTAK